MIAAELELKNPTSANAIRSNFYMDDCFFGAESVDAARKLQQTIHANSAGYGFHLCKYHRNSIVYFHKLVIC